MNLAASLAVLISALPGTTSRTFTRPLATVADPSISYMRGVPNDEDGSPGVLATELSRVVERQSANKHATPERNRSPRTLGARSFGMDGCIHEILRPVQSKKKEKREKKKKRKKGGGTSFREVTEFLHFLLFFFATYVFLFYFCFVPFLATASVFIRRVPQTRDVSRFCFLLLFVYY